jgi:hypothetical protein
MTTKLYPDLFPWDLEPHYSRHVSAMTGEGLHEKSDIAIQLAWRDKRIAELERTKPTPVEFPYLDAAARLRAFVDSLPPERRAEELARLDAAFRKPAPSDDDRFVAERFLGRYGEDHKRWERDDLAALVAEVRTRAEGGSK